MSSEGDNKKDELKRLVIDALKEEFKKPSGHEDINTFCKGLEEGREMQLKILTGGLCNYSYKLNLKGGDDEEDVALFVKLTFGSPVAFPDVPCSPDRTKYEFKAMEMFAKVTPYPKSAITPYGFFDVEGSEENMKIIVMQYSSRLEEQAGNLFVDGGSIDKEYAVKIAKSLSALHSAEVTEPEFNEDMVEFYTAMNGITSMIFAGYLDESDENPNRTALAGRAIGKDGLDEIVDAIYTYLTRKDCYIHGDCHMFNMLFEGTMQAAMNEDENTIGDVAIIDWEFAHCGPQGKDLGWVQVFPIACALAHAVNGDKENSDNIVQFLENFWEAYEASINQDGKDLSLVDIYRQVLAGLGIMLLVYSGVGVHCEYLPVEEGNEKYMIEVKLSLGVLALECFEMGYRGKLEGATLGELRKHFKDAIQTEIDLLSPTVQPRKISFRRSSVLRTTKKRVSDAHSYFSMATDVDLQKELDNEASDSFSMDSSEELRNIYFDTFDSSEIKAPATSRGRRRISVMPRMSLAITDFKRKSIGDWDQMITDFEF
jgi:hypothetical protein